RTSSSTIRTCRSTRPRGPRTRACRPTCDSPGNEGRLGRPPTLSRAGAGAGAGGGGVGGVSVIALVLGAGLGTRFRPATLATPQPLLPLLGRPILFRLLDHLIEEGVERFVLNTHHPAHELACA